MKAIVKYHDQGKNPHAHIGEMVRKQMLLQHFSISEMARRMDVTPSVMGVYLKRSSIQFGILWKLGLALGYNFLADLAMQFPVEFSNKNATEMQNLIKEKEVRIADLEKEISIYKNILSGFKQA